MDEDRKSQAGRSRNARLNQSQDHAKRIVEILGRLKGKTRNEHVDRKDDWFDCRNEVEKLTQCFHEANAYNNGTKDEGEVS